MQMHRQRFGSAGRRLSTERLQNARLPLALRYRSAAAEEASDPLARNAALARVEAVLIMADEPVTSRRLADVAGLDDGHHARRLVDDLKSRYDADGTAFQIEELAGGFQLLTRSIHHSSLLRLRRTGYDLRLSGAALETLAVIAYKQPIMRAEVEKIRGVMCSDLIRVLMEKGLVRVTGRHDSLGRPQLFGTTKKFLQHFGLNAVSDLPEVDALSGAKG
jgi:segregation and condensation protein B